MELIESDQVATLIVKDMSRLGREYLQVGQYTELVFRSFPFLRLCRVPER